MRVEESLENLEYFNVTNLGRMHTEMQASALQEARKSLAGDTGNQKWMERLEEASVSMSSRHKAPRIKSPFPDEPKRLSPMDAHDILDDLLIRPPIKPINPPAQSKQINPKP